MKTAIIATVTMLTAGAVFAGWEDWQYSLYGASFEKYEENEPLDSTKGAWNGWWGSRPVPTQASAVAMRNGKTMYMDYSARGDGIAFTPYDTGFRSLKTVTTRVLMTAYEADVMPDAPEGARAAFSAYSDGGDPVFVGLETANGTRRWVTLHGVAEPPKSNAWYDVSMKFVVKQDAVGRSVRVQYRLKDSLGEFVPLESEDGQTWFAADGDPAREVASKIEYRGDGGIENLNGGEPKRGLLIGLVPWREILVDETVDKHETGDWAVLDPDTGAWAKPFVQGIAYEVNVANGTDGYAFIPKDKQSDALRVVEFAVRFTEPNDNDVIPDDVSALVRVVEEPMTNLCQVSPTYHFACLGGGRWHTNAQIVAELDADYTVEVSQDEKTGAVTYRIRRGYGGEGGAYQTLLQAPMPLYSPRFAFFGGHGLVYEIKSTSKSGK